MVIRNTVGITGANDKGDVAMVQGCLKLISDTSTSRPYLAGKIDGLWGAKTSAALIGFQQAFTLTDQNLGQGTISPAGATITGLTAQLPASDRNLLTLSGIPLVYKEPAGLTGITAAKSEIDTSALQTSLKTKIKDLIDRMYRQHKIVLKIAGDGGRRDFASQARVPVNRTAAGPGESNHQWGAGVDLGVDKFTWLKNDGSFHRDAPWLNELARSGPRGAAEQIWRLRDNIARNQVGGLYTIRTERVHLQSYDSSAVNPVLSLTTLLDSQSRWKWSGRWVRGKSIGKNDFNPYRCDRGGVHGQMVEVGDMRQIWAGNAPVTKASIEKAGWVRPAPGGSLGSTGQAASLPITDADVASVQARLKAILVKADLDWQNWRPRI